MLTKAACENKVMGTSHVCLSTPKFDVVYQAQAVNATELIWIANNGQRRYKQLMEVCDLPRQRA
jgi:hypothetical protein